MRALLTVGTAHFDDLVRTVDSNLPEGWIVQAQIADGEFQPINMEWFRFKDSLTEDYEQADIVICHAGAGTIYQCLEAGKRLVVVPNTSRSDKHQLEIARFLEQNNYALVCCDLANISNVMQQVSTFEPAQYSKEPFNAIPEMRQLIGLD